MDELIYELRAQRDVLLRHFEAIDTKAGLLLGFSAALATLTPMSSTIWLSASGRASAISSSLSALAAFAPRRFPSLQPRVLAAELTADSHEERVTVLTLFLIDSIKRADAVVRSKARILTASFALILVATALLGAGILFHGGRP